MTEDGKLFGWGYSADGRLGKMGLALETHPENPSEDITSDQQEITKSSLEAAEKMVLETMEKENNMPIIWNPCLVEEVHSHEIIDIACGLDHSLILCRK